MEERIEGIKALLDAALVADRQQNHEESLRLLMTATEALESEKFRQGRKAEALAAYKGV